MQSQNTKVAMEEILKLKEFFVEGGSKKQSHVILQIGEPTSLEEKEKGYFFVIGETNNADQNYLTKFYEIIDTAQKNYYKDDCQKNNNSLENILNLINHQAVYLSKPPTSLHCVIGIAYQNDIIFSFCGKPQIVLFYKTTKEGNYERMDLAGDNLNVVESSGTALFSQLIQGKINNNDFLFFGTPHITDQINLDRLQKVITTRNPEQSCQHLENILRQIRSSYSYGGLIMYLEKSTLPTTPLAVLSRQGLENSTKSLHNFFNTEKKTTQTLSSSAGRLTEKSTPKIKQSNYSSTATTTTKNYYHPPSLSQPLSTGLSSSKKFPKINLSWSGLAPLVYYIKKILWSLLTILWTLLTGIYRQFLMVFYVITNYENKRRNTLESWQKQFYSYKQNIKQLPILTKLMLTVCIILVTTFIGSIVYIKNNQEKNKKLKTYQTQLHFIRTKKDSAESALIYKDELTARQEIEEARKSLGELACETKEEKTTCEQLQQNVDEILTKIRKIVMLKPETLVTWEEVSNLKGLVKINNKLVSYNPSQTTLFIYDLDNKQKDIKSITSTTSSGFISATVPKENDYVLLVTDKDELIQFKPDNVFENLTISYDDKNQNRISDLTIYNQRLYRLDTNNNQIYRHDRTNTGFKVGKEWIKDTQTNITDGVSLTIDGDIFILKENGEVVKFSQGIQQPFTIKGLDPKLESGVKIWTYNELKHIYILDSLSQRIIVLDKEGNLKLQLKASEFEQPSDMVIDEEAKTGFIIDKNRLYKINLPL